MPIFFVISKRSSEWGTRGPGAVNSRLSLSVVHHDHDARWKAPSDQRVLAERAPTTQQQEQEQEQQKQHQRRTKQGTNEANQQHHSLKNLARCQLDRSSEDRLGKSETRPFIRGRLHPSSCAREQNFLKKEKKNKSEISRPSFPTAYSCCCWWLLQTYIKRWGRRWSGWSSTFFELFRGKWLVGLVRWMMHRRHEGSVAPRLRRSVTRWFQPPKQLWLDIVVVVVVIFFFFFFFFFFFSVVRCVYVPHSISTDEIIVSRGSSSLHDDDDDDEFLKSVVPMGQQKNALGSVAKYGKRIQTPTYVDSAAIIH